jgi:Tripartite tricarboxylate transporter TctB family
LILKKTFLINDLVWIGFASAVCYGGLRLGFGSFHQPHAGFMPFLSGLVLGLLALADLVIGLINRWKEDPEDIEIWANINWGKLLITVATLFIYTILFSTLGFTIGTILLLLFLFRVMEPKPLWMVLVSSVLCTGLFYLAFKVGLDSQLPRGFLGF